MKKIAFWIVFALANLVVCEVVVTHYFFQQKSDYPFALAHYASHHYRRLAAARPVGIWRDDARLGYAHVPGATGRHRTASFDVTYSIGPQGERRVPQPDVSRGRVLILGCSFTFGWGVEDDEAFPYHLATQHWRDFQIVNAATNGYGTVHAYQQLRAALASGQPPALAIYAMIPTHVCRNYLRPTWLESLAASNRGHPHFELVDGRPEFRGIVRGATRPMDERRLRVQEVALTAALLKEMQREAQKADVPFAVVLLPQKPGSTCGGVEWPPLVIDAIVREGIQYVDLTETLTGISWLPDDQHPDREGHRAIATGIASSSIARMLQDIRLSARP